MEKKWADKYLDESHKNCFNFEMNGNFEEDCDSEYKCDFDIEYIEKNKDKVDWETISSNSELPWSIDFIESCQDFLDWDELIFNAGVPWVINLLKRFQNNIKWGCFVEGPVFDEDGNYDLYVTETTFKASLLYYSNG